MSSQRPLTIPGVFEHPERQVEVLAWGNEISNNNKNKNCFIRRFTHVKNVGSTLLHEYLNVIVVDESTNKWTRLIVERQTNQDQVIIGRWDTFENYDEKWKPQDCFYQSYTSSSGSNYSSGGEVKDFPLPLITRSFEKGCFQLRNLASMLEKFHNQHPKYNLFQWNCYWFSRSIFDGVSIKLKFVDHKWAWFSWRGKKLAITVVKWYYKELEVRRTPYEISEAILTTFRKHLGNSWKYAPRTQFMGPLMLFTLIISISPRLHRLLKNMKNR